MAHSGKSLAIGVTTGISTDEDFATQPPSKRAHVVFSGVDELLELYAGLKR
jgi:hypothetical protein